MKQKLSGPIEAHGSFVLSPDKVFGDIMVLALPPCPPINPDDMNALNSKNIQRISFKFYMSVDTP